MPPAALRLPLDLPDQQVDGPVDVVGLDVADDGVEEAPDLLMVRGRQRSPLLHWRHKTVRQPPACFLVVAAALNCGKEQNPRCNYRRMSPPGGGPANSRGSARARTH